MGHNIGIGHSTSLGDIMVLKGRFSYVVLPSICRKMVTHPDVSRSLVVGQ